MISACALPYEQLSLPAPITGSLPSDRTDGAATDKGVPMSSAASRGTKGVRLYEGSGKFTSSSSDGAARGTDAGGTAASSGTATADTATAEVAGSGSTASGSAGLTFGKAASASAGADGITLNLANASIAEAAKLVLGETLGVNYMVSDKVKGSITLRTVRPIDKAGLVTIFDAVLRGEGAALIAEPNLYRIVPAAEVSAGGAPLLPRGGRVRQQAGVGTEAVPLRFVAAAEMERILRSAAPQAGILRVDAARNLLLVSGTQSELGSMRELVQMFDVDWMKGMSFAILPIETADVDAIAQELDAIFANDRDSPSKGLIRFLPNKRLKSILAITSRPEYLRKAETWLKRIDMASRATEKQVHVYHVQHRPANELAALLQKVYLAREGRVTTGAIATASSTPARPSGVATAPTLDGLGTQSVSAGSTTGGLGSPGTGAGQTAASPFAVPAIQPPPQPGFTSAAPSDSAQRGPEADAASAGIATSEATRSAIGGGLPPDDRMNGIAIVADEVNNSLVITATANEYKRMRQILTSIDIAANQVMLEATIAEVTLNDKLKFGLRWFMQKGGNQFSFTNDALGAIAPTFPGFNYVLSMTNVQVVLNALSSQTDVNVVSSPTLMVLENKKAVLQIGDEVPITTQSAVGVGAPGAPIVNSVSFRSTGVILGITPRVSDDGRVLLEIEQEISDAVKTTSSTIDSPTIQQRRVKTMVAVRDGETILLAGMMQDKATRERDQIPLLGTLPVVGNAFKNKTDTIARTELLIAITPQVVRNSHQIDGIAAEYRDKLNLSTRPQRATPPDHKEQLDRLAR